MAQLRRFLRATPHISARARMRISAGAHSAAYCHARFTRGIIAARGIGQKWTAG
jgi:hypothetical protein